MNVYNRIDAILKDRKLSRRKLAIMAGIPPTSLQSAFSRNVDDISSGMLQKISKALECSADDLLGVDTQVHIEMSFDASAKLQNSTNANIAVDREKLKQELDKLDGAQLEAISTVIKAFNKNVSDGGG